MFLNYNVLTNKESDKYGHWFVSTALTSSIMSYNKKLGVISVIGLGIAKEIYDSKTGGYFSLQDMQANLTGVLFGIAINIAQEDKRSNYIKPKINRLKLNH